MVIYSNRETMCRGSHIHYQSTLKYFVADFIAPKWVNQPTSKMYIGGNAFKT